MFPWAPFAREAVRMGALPRVLTWIESAYYSHASVERTRFGTALHTILDEAIKSNDVAASNRAIALLSAEHMACEQATADALIEMIAKKAHGSNVLPLLVSAVNAISSMPTDLMSPEAAQRVMDIAARMYRKSMPDAEWMLLLSCLDLVVPRLLSMRAPVSTGHINLIVAYTASRHMTSQLASLMADNKELLGSLDNATCILAVRALVQSGHLSTGVNAMMARQDLLTTPKGAELIHLCFAACKSSLDHYKAAMCLFGAVAARRDVFSKVDFNQFISSLLLLPPRYDRGAFERLTADISDILGESVREWPLTSLGPEAGARLFSLVHSQDPSRFAESINQLMRDAKNADLLAYIVDIDVAYTKDLLRIFVEAAKMINEVSLTQFDY